MRFVSAGSAIQNLTTLVADRLKLVLQNSCLIAPGSEVLKKFHGVHRPNLVDSTSEYLMTGP